MCVRFIFDPNEPYKIRWDLWIGALIMYSVIAIPYRLCFDVGRPISEMSEYSSAELGEFIWNKSVDVFFFIDMVFAFRTGYHDMAEDALITMPHDIARHYLRTWFLIDFFSCFPIEECMLPFSDGSGSSSAAGATKLLKVIRLFRLLKLVRLLKLSKYMDKIEDAVGVSPAVFEIIKLICQPASASAHAAEAPPAGAAASGKAERRETLEGSRVQSRTTALQPAPPQPISQQPPPLTPRAIGITVVGDDDQSIYSFRGAQPGMFFAFGRHMQGCGTVTLSQNYRSSGSIVQGATAVIQRNPQRIDKQVWTARDKGDPIEVCECRNIACEHDLVVSKLREIQNANGSLADVAVLYRTHAVGRGVYHALKENRIPCTTSSADTFARPDVQPLIAALRLITNTEDDASFRAVATSTSPTIDGALLNKVVVEAVRVGGSLHAAAKSLHAGSRMLAMDSSLATGGSIGPAQLDSAACKALHALLHKIDELRRAARTLPPSQLLANVMRSGLLTSLNPDRPPHGAKLLADELTAGMGSGEAAASSQRLSLNVGTPCSTPGAPSGRMPPPPGATDRLTALRAFLEHSAMSEHEDAGAGNGGRPVGVTLSTIHGAKGREWATVLIVRVNEETLPLSMPTDDEEGENLHELVEVAGPLLLHGVPKMLQLSVVEVR